MREVVIHNIENFLNDFQYFKLHGYDVFQQSFQSGSKLIVSNLTPYDDGLMLEIQLGVRLDNVEKCIFDFQQQEPDKLSLTYWESLYQIFNNISKRSFIQNEVELSKVLAEIEVGLVKKGFNWLDEMQDVQKLSSYIYNVIFKAPQKSSNIFKLCQRSYLIRNFLGEQISDATFYKYYEQMQLLKVPMHQLEEFIAFKNYLKAYLLK
ncbi:hypothetical protein SAMN05661096_00834 [Marivirga sericea]|uniref:Uncharacterized protein n=1 Tax=Marivirga sericea TaxID=1028 RepID=A0A1X7INI0_9BACT|nr:hypothetical protein [Marivirga sericea]SMG16261.1 hypothetical protein SAMN05661096_00834 [Marivirga sericea]